MSPRSTRLAPLSAAILFLVSSCAAPASRTKNVLLGAAAGTFLGAGFGCLTAYDIDRDDPTTYVIGCMSGAAVGALLGGTAGYLLSPAPPPPPSPPPPAIARPAPTPTPVPAPPAPPTERIVLRGVHFDFDESDIRPDDEPTLAEAAQTLKEHPNLRVYVDGYCDIIGTMEYNQKLSERRANAVVDYLEGEGIPASRMVPRGFGKTHFVATNDTEEGRAQNRRAEIVPVE